MAETNDEAVTQVADSLAKAIWTLVRNGAKLQSNLASKLILMADGALRAIDVSDGTRRKTRAKRRAPKSRK